MRLKLIIKIGLDRGSLGLGVQIEPHADRPDEQTPRPHQTVSFPYGGQFSCRLWSAELACTVTWLQSQPIGMLCHGLRLFRTGQAPLRLKSAPLSEAFCPVDIQHGLLMPSGPSRNAHTSAVRPCNTR
ncbi:unnamed protein product [Protopolystoma xenopodis]|uniref:Uncharacterized protein n=1 Tax=Protopolystoma xenopodis TaxID=117903 RepID=A0A448XGE0_9PLAT|nr:unnamed protein product [Protopolystoma xenopodis]